LSAPDFALAGGIALGYARVMVVKAMVFGIVGMVATGCVWERNVDKRMARLQLGVNSRQLTTAAPADKPNYVLRTTQPAQQEQPQPAEPTQVASSGVTGSLQFTMRYPHNNVPIYMGGELEAGPLENSGYLGGAYGVVGAEASSGRGSLSVEMSGGRRWLRAELGAEDLPSWVLEPRVRGQFTLTPQVTLGGVLGANALPDESGWMAGVYVGIFSSPIDGSK
jgi:hypothetical protein